MANLLKNLASSSVLSNLLGVLGVVVGTISIIVSVWLSDEFAANREGEMDVVAATAEYVFPYMVIATVLIYVFVVCRSILAIVPAVMPTSFKVRFWVYREQAIRNLSPEVVKALDYLEAWQSLTDPTSMAFVRNFAAWRGQLGLISSKLNELGCDVTVGNTIQWEWFLPNLEPFLRAGNYEDVKALCDCWRKRLTEGSYD